MSLSLFYINLDRVPERRSFMEKQAAMAGIADSLQRVAATDGQSSVEIHGYRPHDWGPRWALTRSESACFDSHRRAWRNINGTPAIVAEDDVILSDQFANGLSAAQNALRPGEIIKLDGISMEVRYGKKEPIDDGFSLRSILQTPFSAGCYLVSVEAAALMRDRSTVFCDHLDDFIFDPSAPWTISQLEPAVAVQSVLVDVAGIAKVVKSSERTQDAGTNRPKPRGPILYRAMKEARRSARKARRRLWADRALLAAGGHIGSVPLADDLGEYI